MCVHVGKYYKHKRLFILVVPYVSFTVVVICVLYSACAKCKQALNHNDSSNEYFVELCYIEVKYITYI